MKERTLLLIGMLVGLSLVWLGMLSNTLENPQEKGGGTRIGMMLIGIVCIGLLAGILMVFVGMLPD